MGGGSAVTLGGDVARTESMFTDGPWRPKGNEANGEAQMESRRALGRPL